MRAPLLLLPLLLLGCSEYSLNSPPPTVADEPPAEEPSPAPAPAIEVLPEALDFGVWLPECIAGPLELAVINVGEADLDVQAITLASNEDQAYRIQATPGLLAPGESLTVQVEFRPPTLGSFDSTWIEVISDAANEPRVEVPLLGEGEEHGPVTEQFVQNDIMPVDVLWVIDNSGSMGSNINALVTEFELFINAFVALGLDYQIGVISTDMDDPSHSGQLQGPIITSTHPDPVAAFMTTASMGTDGSADERPLDAAFAALSPPLIDGPNLGLVRPDSHLSVLVITDENDSSDISANAFSNWLNAYQGAPDQSSLSALMGPKGGLTPCLNGLFGGSATPAPKLWNVIQQTGGIHMSICDMNMTVMLPRLAAVSAGLDLFYTLSHPVSEPSQIEVWINGVNVPYGTPHGFTFDPDTNTIYFHGAAVPPPNANIEVRYPALLVCPT